MALSERQQKIEKRIGRSCLSADEAGMIRFGVGIPIPEEEEERLKKQDENWKASVAQRAWAKLAE